MKTLGILSSTIALIWSAAAFAEPTATGQSKSQERIGAIFNTLFGDRSAATSLDTQWTLGRKPLATQRTQFETRVDTEVRNGTVSQTTASRLKTDYLALVDLEAKYGADQRFTTAERTDLADRYGLLTQTLVDGRYGDEISDGAVGKGKADFERRVDASVTSRRISRAQGTTLKADYAALIATETTYLKDGSLSATERNDLDEKLDALDVRVGDTSYGNVPAAPTTRSRLDAITTALPSSGLAAAAKKQLQVEQADLLRLEAAYTRVKPSEDDQAYLERRIVDLEKRARVKR